MKVAIAYSTRDQVELTRQTFARMPHNVGIFWVDGSTTEEGKNFAFEADHPRLFLRPDIYGGADAAIVYKLTAQLQHTNNYTHVGLVENDVLLDPDWLDPTLSLFERGRSDGLEVGAVSARSYVDRVLIQRDGYAVMHNLGAGMVIYTREAAELVLDNFRTHWAPHTRSTWARISGIDIGRYWAFRGNEQWNSSDWGYDALLACHGLASLALVPAKCDMIGQVPSLAEQGLQLTTATGVTVTGVTIGGVHAAHPENFKRFVERTREIRENKLNPNSPSADLAPCVNGDHIVFPHLAPKFGATYAGDWRLQWEQGFGPFAYRAGPGGASLTVPVFGSSCFLLSGGKSGATCSVKDSRSGYSNTGPLQPNGEIANIVVPGGVVYRDITMELTEGGVFYGYHSPQRQMWNPSVRFDHSTLPPV